MEKESACGVSYPSERWAAQQRDLDVDPHDWPVGHESDHERLTPEEGRPRPEIKDTSCIYAMMCPIDR